MTAASAAHSLAEEYGIRVFPCRPRDEVVNGKNRKAKEPLTAHGFEDASTNADCIDAWFHEHPDALVGVPTGTENKLFVVDIDPDGVQWYQENQTRLACGRVHKTRRGYHLVYRMPAVELRNTASQLARGVDTRGIGGYIIWWPAHGLEATGGLEDLTEPPAWLIEALKKPAPSATNTNNGRAKYGEGERHKALLSRASGLRHKGLHGAELEGALLAWNAEHCEPPQDEADVRRIARDYAEKPEDADVAQAIEDVRGLRLTSLGELGAMPAIISTPLIKDLLYPGAWLVVGRPKIGKSWLILQLTLAVAEQGTFLGFNCEAAGSRCCAFSAKTTTRASSHVLRRLASREHPITATSSIRKSCPLSRSASPAPSPSRSFSMSGSPSIRRSASS